MVYQRIYVQNKYIYIYMYESAFFLRLKMANIYIYIYICVGLFFTCTYMNIHNIGLSFVKCSTVNVWIVLVYLPA